LREPRALREDVKLRAIVMCEEGIQRGLEQGRKKKKEEDQI
jgi:flagellar biosynthesis/type III secretory pathway protein FliH